MSHPASNVKSIEINMKKLILMNVLTNREENSFAMLKDVADMSMHVVVTSKSRPLNCNGLNANS